MLHTGRTTELNLLGLAFVGVNTLALLHIDFQQRIQLLARDINVDEIQLSPVTSSILPPVSLPQQWFPVEDHPPRLVFVSADQGMDRDFTGGVLVVGGRKILFYDLALGEAAERNLSRARRIEQKKRSADAEGANKAKQKENEREWRKRKARAVVNWPWSEVTACVPSNHPCLYLSITVAEHARSTNQSISSLSETSLGGWQCCM